MWGTDVWGGFVWGGPTAVPLLSPIGVIVLAACLVTVGTLMLCRRGACWALSVLGVTVLMVPLVAYATTISIPHLFSNGTTADADEVNANFDALVIESNAQNSRIAGIETAIATLPSDVASNTSGIATNTSGISSNSFGIATNLASIGTNASDIFTLQSSAATNSSDIATNQSNIAANTTAIATNSSGISTNAAAIAANTADISALDPRLLTEAEKSDLTDGGETTRHTHAGWALEPWPTLEIHSDASTVSGNGWTIVKVWEFQKVPGHSVSRMESNVKADNADGSALIRVYLGGNQVEHSAASESYVTYQDVFDVSSIPDGSQIIARLSLNRSCSGPCGNVSFNNKFKVYIQQNP